MCLPLATPVILARHKKDILNVPRNTQFRKQNKIDLKELSTMFGYTIKQFVLLRVPHRYDHEFGSPCVPLVSKHNDFSIDWTEFGPPYKASSQIQGTMYKSLRGNHYVVTAKCCD